MLCTLVGAIYGAQSAYGSDIPLACERNFFVFMQQTDRDRTLMISKRKIQEDKEMKLRKLIALTVTVAAAFIFTACGNSEEEVQGPTGIFITYGDEQEDKEMKLRKLIALTVTVAAAFIFTACGNSEEEVQGPTGIFITYGDENQSYAFVDPETDMVFLAELPLDKIKDNKGNTLKLEDLKDGDKIQLAGSGIMTNSIPPIYADIKEAIRLEEGSEELAEKYRPLIEEYLDPPADPSMIPAFSIEFSQSAGTVSTAVYETSYEWNYTDDRPLIEEYLDPPADPSMIPAFSIEFSQSAGTVSTAVYETSYEWNYTDGNGEEQNLVLNEGSEAEYSMLDLEKESEEGTFYFSSNPKEMKLFEYVGEETKEVEVTKTEQGYTACFKPNMIYELQGIWENGTVNYKFYQNRARLYGLF